MLGMEYVLLGVDVSEWNRKRQERKRERERETKTRKGSKERKQPEDTKCSAQEEKRICEARRVIKCKSDTK